MSRLTTAIVIAWLVGVACGFGAALIMDARPHNAATESKSP
jgi:hypothetical protein